MASIQVKVRSILSIKKILGSGEVKLTVPRGSTLGRLLDAMVERWGCEFENHVFVTESRDVLPHIRLMVNGQDIAFINGMETVLQEEDEILILPPVGGG